MQIQNIRQDEDEDREKWIQYLENQIGYCRRSFSRMKSEAERAMYARNFSHTPLRQDLEAMEQACVGIADLKWKLKQAGMAAADSVSGNPPV